tara:strand:- start:122 stop:1339 length:1218 start_codon:yes stop_codon:yes gene_type:complete
MKIKNCRICNSRKLKKLFSLGNMKFTGKFPKKNQFIPSGDVELIICNRCKLVQLRDNFNLKYLYNKDYGYRTGINLTMRKHVKSVVKKITKKVKLKKNDYVLDIASNDGTLLSYYSQKINTFGIDPLIDKYKKNYQNISYKVSDFFSCKNILKIDKKIKFKAITALSVFYDIKKPKNFLRDIKKVLHKDGIFNLEFADLKLILKNNMFDTICHEHLEYYSVTVINNLLNDVGLRVFDHNYNDINGGSSSYYICHKDSKFKTSKKIPLIMREEKRININSINTYRKFKSKIDKIKSNLLNLLKNLKKQKKTIHGYGASTKGNVLLQYFNIDKRYLDCISDRNPKKNNCYTPGTNIKILTEKKSRSLNPDYYLVLPWHFKREILKREKNMRRNGTKFIFPLPIIKII